MVTDREEGGLETVVFGGGDQDDGADWVEIGAVDVGDLDDPSVSAGGDCDIDVSVVAAGAVADGARTETEKMALAGLVARRHAHGFAVLKMFPMIEFYVLHVYVLLQLPL